MEYITIAGQQIEVSFDIDDNEQTVVETKAMCPTCPGGPTDWHYSQLCQEGYPGVLTCGDCDFQVRLESRKDEAK